MTAHFPRIVGSKGGTSDAKNTLQSKALVRIVEVISEGECVGLVDGLKSVYFDKTSIIAPDDAVNFKGVTVETRPGTPDQTHITGSPYVETLVNVNTEVTFDNGPVVRTITETNADSVRLIATIPQLYKSTDDGMKTFKVTYAFDVRPFGGEWVTKVFKEIRNEKCVSPTQFAHVVDLPAGGAPWDVRMRRISVDETDDKKQNETYFDSYVILVKGKFTYPNSAIAFLDIDSEHFGSSIPERSYRWRGIICEVPTNYDAIAHTYTGIWDGTFKRSWTSNPAWVLRDILINNRYGLGDLIDIATIDKWGLYQIAQYCDEMVPSGFSDINGNKIYEPRFQFNGVINSRKDAYQVIRDIASAFRGITFWSIGQIFAVADIPSDPVKLVSPANVIDGHFEYSGTALSARHSVALVKWNNPDDFYAPATEPVIDDTAIERYGWRETSYQAVGCTSRGQAHRLGRWILDVEQNETETVQYTCSFDHMDVRPFDIISIADPRKAQFRNGGRVREIPALNQIIVDAPIEVVDGDDYIFSVELPDGLVQSLNVTSFIDLVDDKAAGVVLDGLLNAEPVAGAMWVIASQSAVPRQYRVLTIQETDKHLFKITALFHDPNKYARVEDETVFQPIRYSKPRDSIKPPINPNAVQSTWFADGVANNKILLSWTASDDFMAIRYNVYAETPEGLVDYGEMTGTSLEIGEVFAGTYEFKIVAISLAGYRSPELLYTFEAQGWEATDLPVVSGLKLTNGVANVFTGTDAEISWVNTFGTATTGNNPFYKRNNVEVYDATETTPVLLREDVVFTPSYVYTIDKNRHDADELGRSPARKLKFVVTVTDTLDRTSSSVELTVENPAPATPVVSIQAGFEQIFISWSGSVDTDYAGTLVWVDQSTGFDPAITAPVFNGTGGAYSFPAPDAVPYYIRVGHYDRFSLMPANISSEVTATPSALEVDTIPPEVPVGLALDSHVETVAGVDQRVVLSASWTAATEDDFAYYEIQIKQNTGNYVGFQTGINSHEWSVLPSQSFTAKVRAVDAFGNASAYCTPVTLISDDSDTLAELINAGSTTIEPGKITISGATTLADWRKGGDETKIDGGALSAATVATESLTVGNRNVKWEGLQFEHNSPGGNQVAWTSGTISYVGDDGNIHTRTIAGGNALWSSGTLYLYWVKDATSISSTTAVATAMAPNNVVLAAYKGNIDLVTDYGRTVIDGSNIKTGSIDTQQIKANAITAGLIAAGTINASHIQAQSIDVSKLTLNDATNLAPDNQMITVSAWNIGALWGLVPSTTYGFRSKGDFTYAWVSGQTGYGAALVSAEFPVAQGEEYYFSYQTTAAGVGDYAIRGRVQWLNAAGAEISMSEIFAGVTTAVDSVPIQKTANFFAPANAKTAKMHWDCERSTTTVVPSVGGVVARKRFGAELIVNGAITAEKLDVTSLSAITADMGFITAGRMESPDGNFIIDLNDGFIEILN